jgi:hypothetical protein
MERRLETAQLRECSCIVLASLHMQTADDLFGTPQGSPRTDKLIAASIQGAVQIMKKIDAVCGKD